MKITIDDLSDAGTSLCLHLTTLAFQQYNLDVKKNDLWGGGTVFKVDDYEYLVFVKRNSTGFTFIINDEKDKKGKLRTI